mgnify:FL=1
MRRVIIPLLFALAGCNTTTGPFEVPTRGFVAAPQAELPELKVAPTRSASAQRSNTSIAQDFLTLNFALESGSQLHQMTRFEGPISVRLDNSAPQTAKNDLSSLLTRLRTEAGLNIYASSSRDANINIEMVTRAQIKRLIPNAACFVAPNARSLADYSVKRRTSAGSWTAMTDRTMMSIFLPSDASPKEVRDCLHEELAQALGPVNDLYSLSDSVFNDDNIHSTLTSFDMMVLRVQYDRELTNGMSRQQVAARLPSILARVNPAGSNVYGTPSASISPRWNDAIHTALGAGTSDADRIAAAQRAINIASFEGFEDVRTGFGYFVLGRVTMGSSAEVSKRAFVAADRTYAALPGTNLHRAFVATQLAAFTLADGDTLGTINIVRPFMAIAKNSGNAALLSTMMLLEAEALEMAGQVSQARSVRVDSLDFARYGFGSEKAVEARLREIAALSPS